MKLGWFMAAWAVVVVAPHAGAWIEILSTLTSLSDRLIVAPHAGAWIEILYKTPSMSSQPVAPHAGAWIEIF